MKAYLVALVLIRNRSRREESCEESYPLTTKGLSVNSSASPSSSSSGAASSPKLHSETISPPAVTLVGVVSFPSRNPS